MKLADDRRARVPFAVIAVLLLVGSATLSATMHGRPPGGADPDTDAAIDRATAATRTALTDAVKEAARDAAQEPVIAAANTTYGRVLRGENPFRRYLRARIYLAVRDSLHATATRVGDVEARASLPPVENASSLRRAIERVRLRAGNGTLQVTVSNLTTTATRRDRRIVRERRSVTVGVETPVLQLYERTETYERRLNRGPIDGPGLGRKISAALYALSWIRGYAFYHSGHPENVLANRHVEWVTNLAALMTQRSVFGSTDGAGETTLRRALAVNSLIQVANLGGVDVTPGTRTAIIQAVQPEGPLSAGLPDLPSGSHGPEEQTTVGVNRTADVAFLNLLRGAGGPSLEAIQNDTYAARARVLGAVEQVRDEDPPDADPPGQGWTLVDETTTTNRSVEAIEAAPRPRIPTGWYPHDRYAREVTVVATVERTYERGNDSRTTVRKSVDRYRVGLTLVDYHAPSQFAARRGIDHVHEAGGPLDGANLRTTPARARERLVTSRGGPDELASAAVEGSLNGSPILVRARHPARLDEWVYDDLAALRERVRNVTVAISKGKLGTTGNAPAELADRIRSRREQLLDAPPTYRSVADKVRVAARAAYLERVLARLDARATDVEESKSDLSSEFPDFSLSEVREIMVSRDESNPPAPIADAGHDGQVSIAVDSAPAYLALAKVDHDSVPAVAENRTFVPLVARNQNVGGLPYGDAVDTAVDSFMEGEFEGVDLREAALALRSVNRTLSAVEREQSNETGGENGLVLEELRAKRTLLRAAVSASLSSIQKRVVDRLESVTNSSATQLEPVVEAGFDRWQSVDARALAAVNGSAILGIANATEARTTGSDRILDRVETELRVALPRIVAGTGSVPKYLVAGTVDRSRSTAEKLVARESKKQVEKLVDTAETVATRKLNERIEDLNERLEKRGRTAVDTFDSVPLGIPITPIPTQYYAALSYWSVSVAGSYARFTVTARRGEPGGAAATLSLSRDGDTVSLDIDDDGAAERLGRADRIDFETTTAVVVVTPPYGNGIGDANGDVDERSTGWPSAGVQNSSVPAIRSTGRTTVPAWIDSVVAVDPRNGGTVDPEDSGGSDSGPSDRRAGPQETGPSTTTHRQKTTVTCRSSTCDRV